MRVGQEERTIRLAKKGFPGGRNLRVRRCAETAGRESKRRLEGETGSNKRMHRSAVSTPQMSYISCIGLHQRAR